MRRLIWFETALVFGALIPLLLPLLALQLFMDAHILEWRLSKAPSAFGDGKQLSVQRRTMQCHVVAVLLLQSALSMFFFVDSQLHGWQGVVVVLPLICVGMLIAQVWGVQLRDFWLLVYRHNRPLPTLTHAICRNRNGVRAAAEPVLLGRVSVVAASPRHPLGQVAVCGILVLPLLVWLARRVLVSCSGNCELRPGEQCMHAP